MLNERNRKELVLEHCRRMNAGDIDRVMELYADDVGFEDPVGWVRQTGREALRDHLREAISADVRETPGEPVVGQDGASVLVPVTAVMDYLPSGPVFAGRGWLSVPGRRPEDTRLQRDYMLLIRAGESGLITELKAYWGKSDLTVLA